MAFDLVLKNGRPILPNVGPTEADLGIKDGKIATIAKTIARSEAAKVLDLDGKPVFPGVIDAHSHFGIYQPLEQDARTESEAAITGGITAVMNIIRPRPYYLNMSGPLKGVLKALLEKSKNSFIVDYAYALGPLELSHLGELDDLYDQGVSTFKYWMHYRDYKFSEEEPYDSGYLYRLMKSVAKINADKGRRARVSVHCEDPDIIRVSGNTGYGLREDTATNDENSKALESYNMARPPQSEAAAIARVIQLAHFTKCPANILHITSKLAMDATVKYSQMYPDVDVTREVVVHHLVLTTSSECQVLAKVNPPIRHRADVEALWNSIKVGQVDVVASDHAAIPLELKQGGVWKALFGFGGNTLVLPVMLTEGFHKRGLTLTKISELLSTNPAKIHGFYPRKGIIAVGADADLAVVDLNKTVKVSPKVLNSSQEFTPFEGYVAKGWAETTIIRGKIVIDDGQVVGKPGSGEFVPLPVR